jgi:hypothetical protein
MLPMLYSKGSNQCEANVRREDEALTLSQSVLFNSELGSNSQELITNISRTDSMTLSLVIRMIPCY